MNTISLSIFFKVLFVIYFVHIVSVILADRSKWVDPGDMLRYDFASKSMKPVGNHDQSKELSLKQVKNQAAESTAEHLSSREESTRTGSNDRTNSEIKYFRRFIHYLINRLSYDPARLPDDEEVVFDAQIKLKKEDFTILKNFANSVDSGPMLNDVDTILSRMIQSTKPKYRDDESSEEIYSYFYNFSFYKNHALNDVIIIIGSSLLIAYISITLIRHLTLLGCLFFSFVIVISASCVIEYISLSQKAEAEQLYKQSQFDGIPRECQPSQLSTFESCTRYLKLNIIGMEDNCKAYYKTMIVNEQLEITPATVITSLAGKVGIMVAEIFGKSVSTFLDGVMDGKSFLSLLIIIPTMLVIFWITCRTVLRSVPRIVYEMRREHRIDDRMTSVTNRFLLAEPQVQLISPSHRADSQLYSSVEYVNNVQQPQLTITRSAVSSNEIIKENHEGEDVFYDASSAITNISPTRPVILICRDSETQT